MHSSLHPSSSVTAESTQRPTGKDVRPNRAPGQTQRILLVEESPLLRSRHEGMLSQYTNFKVTGLAAAEAEAVEKLDTIPSDAIVVDVELRPGSGIGVIREAAVVKIE